MTRPSSLAGLRVIVTRPAHQAEALCLMLEQQGAEAAQLPLFAIDAAGDAEAQRGLLAQRRDADGWIFTSSNAVRFAVALDSGSWPTLYAIGGATAAALEAAGHSGAVAPAQGASSEALLELPAFANVSGKRFLIVTGEDGREHLADDLVARGATVEILALYRRRPLDYAPSRIAAEVKVSDAVVLTSGEALDRLWAITPEDLRPRLLTQQLLVPSRRVREKAEALGFVAPLVPETVSDDAILRGLIQWRASAASQASMTEPASKPAPDASTPTLVDPVRAAARAERANAARNAAPPKPRSGGGSALPWLLVLLLAAALGYGGWVLWDLRENQAALQQSQEHALRRLARQSADLDSQTAQLTARQTDLGRQVQRGSVDLAALQGRVDGSEQLVGRLSEELQGGRTRFQLASIEQLLLLASDRLLLERDGRTALLALQIADQRLAQINDPRLFKVREAIASERTQLQALPRPDLTSASLTLSSLIDRAGALPLRARVAPRHFGGARRNADEDADDAQAPWTERLWDSVRGAVSSLFVIRRDDNANTLRLLPAEDEAVIVHVLILKLESARVAMLRGDTQSFRESTRSAADWLRQFFREEDSNVVAALAEIDRLQPLELSAPPPDISPSLTLLRQVLESPAP